MSLMIDGESAEKENECRERSSLAQVWVKCMFLPNIKRDTIRSTKFRLNITYRRRRQWYARQLLKKVDFRCTSRMDFHEKHCVHLVRLQVYAAMQLLLCCALHCLLFITSAMRTPLSSFLFLRKLLPHWRYIVFVATKFMAITQIWMCV